MIWNSAAESIAASLVRNSNLEGEGMQEDDQELEVENPDKKLLFSDEQHKFFGFILVF